jgi:hypothetical protein
LRGINVNQIQYDFCLKFFNFAFTFVITLFSIFIKVEFMKNIHLLTCGCILLYTGNGVIRLHEAVYGIIKCSIQ